MSNNYEMSALMYADDIITPELETPSIQRTYGKEPMNAREYSFCNAQMLHCAFTQLSLKQGIKRWGQAGKDAVTAEMHQMHNKSVIRPIHPDSMTNLEKLRALRSIIFLKQKRDGRIKARACADGRPQRKIYKKEDASSPTVKTESVILSAVQDAMENRDVAVADIPGAFLNAYLDDLVHMRLEGILADALIQLDPNLYGPAASNTSSGKTLLFVELT